MGSFSGYSIFEPILNTNVLKSKLLHKRIRYIIVLYAKMIIKRFLSSRSVYSLIEND